MQVLINRTWIILSSQDPVGHPQAGRVNERLIKRIKIFRCHDKIVDDYNCTKLLNRGVNQHLEVLFLLPQKVPNIRPTFSMWPT